MHQLRRRELRRHELQEWQMHDNGDNDHDGWFSHTDSVSTSICRDFLEPPTNLPPTSTQTGNEPFGIPTTTTTTRPTNGRPASVHDNSPTTTTATTTTTPTGGFGVGGATTTTHRGLSGGGIAGILVLLRKLCDSPSSPKITEPPEK
jgi:hypothetical protein